MTRGEIALIAVPLLAVACYIVGPSIWLQWKASQLIGKREATVIESLGRPRVTLSAAEVGALTPAEHPWDYADRPLPYPVTHKVLHYSGGASGVLIYIGTDGKAEHLVVTDP